MTNSLFPRGKLWNTADIHSVTREQIGRNAALAGIPVSTYLAQLISGTAPAAKPGETMPHDLRPFLSALIRVGCMSLARRGFVANAVPPRPCDVARAAAEYEAAAWAGYMPEPAPAPAPKPAPPEPEPAPYGLERNAANLKIVHTGIRDRAKRLGLDSMDIWDALEIKADTWQEWGKGMMPKPHNWLKMVKLYKEGFPIEHETPAAPRGDTQAGPIVTDRSRIPETLSEAADALAAKDRT